MTPRPIIGYAIPTDPTPAMLEQERERSQHRLERHNASVDQALADDGACAQIHLPTGRICQREHHHPGSCQFDPPPH